MSTITDRFTVIFPAEYDERAEYETPLKGFLTEVVVQFDDSSRYQLSFFDPTRLQQDMEAFASSGKACLAEVNLIVLPEVTTESIRRAVAELVHEGFFQHLKPL